MCMLVVDLGIGIIMIIIIMMTIIVLFCFVLFVLFCSVCSPCVVFIFSNPMEENHNCTSLGYKKSMLGAEITKYSSNCTHIQIVGLFLGCQ